MPSSLPSLEISIPFPIGGEHKALDILDLDTKHGPRPLEELVSLFFILF